jgi:hypothetical protein
VPARQPADAAAEGVAGHADVGRRARQRREAERRCGRDHPAPPRARADGRDLPVGVDEDLGHRGGVEEQVAVSGRVRAVSGGPDGERELALAGGEHGGAHVLRPQGGDRQRRHAP